MPQRFVKDWTQVMPFPDATELQFRISTYLALITAWNAALSGRFVMTDVLQVIARQANACNIALYRADENRAWPIASSVRAHDSQSPETSSGNILRFLKETRASDLYPGAIFRLSELRKDADFQGTDGFREWEARPRIVEVSIFILDATDRSVDAMEFIFDGPVKRSKELPSEIVTHAMANAWELRTPGVMSRLIKTYGKDRAPIAPQSDSPILGADNPCGLSRAEQRVCALLAEGAKAKDISAGLGVSMSTVRSHLRNIYAKTETAGHVELLTMMNGRSGTTE